MSPQRDHGTADFQRMAPKKKNIAGESQVSNGLYIQWSFLEKLLFGSREKKDGELWWFLMIPDDS